MLTAPVGVTEDDVRNAARSHWLPGAVTALHLPVGFGAHHWQVGDDSGSRLFVTLDALGHPHSAESLERAYDAAAELARAGLRAVWPPLPARSGTFTVPFAGGALSATGWLEGRTPTREEAGDPGHARELRAVLDALHACPPPSRIPEWVPRVDAGFPRQLRAAITDPWIRGPFGEEARAAITGALRDVDRWVERCLELAGAAGHERATWVPTHGEPHHRNQVVTADGLRLVDWESLALAPRERDLGVFADLAGPDEPTAARELGAREPMLELFRLDWRLSEIAEYTAWFRGPHGDGPDDRTALGGLFEELTAAGPG